MDNNENKEEEHSKINYNRALAFFEDKLPIHVECGRSFYNGRIMEAPKEKYFFLNDRKIGKIMIFFSEITRPLIIFEEVNNHVN